MRDKDMTDISQVLQEELAEAFEVKDEKALKRYVMLLMENVMGRERAERQFVELRSDIKVLAETMQEGFRQMEKRFEQVDRRFEDMYHYMDKRFEQVDKRFEDLNKRIGFMSWFTPTIVTLLLTLVMAAMKFL